MNNSDITGDAWMSLNQQVTYMCKYLLTLRHLPRHGLTSTVILSAVVVTVSVSIAFSPWVRTVLDFCFHVPLAYAAEYSGVRHFWKSSPLEGGKVKRRNHISMAKISRRRQEMEEARRKSPREVRKMSGGGYEGMQHSRFRRRPERVETMV